MKICIISSTFPPQANGRMCGIGDYTYNLAQHLISFGFKIDILTSTDYVGEMVLSPSLHILPLIENWNYRSWGQIRTLFKENKYETVCLQYQPGIYGSKWSLYNASLPLCCWRNGRFVTIFHTLYYPSPFSPTRINAFFIAAASHQIIVTNEKHRKELLRLYPKAKNKHHLIPVSSNIIPSDDRWHNRHNIRAHTRKKLGVSDDQILISNFGLVYPEKCLEILIGAAKKLHDADCMVHVLFIGQVPQVSDRYYVELKQLIQENDLENHVTWIHDCPVNEVSEYLLASDIYAIPYKDGLTTRRTSAFAGMSHGLPTVSTFGEGTPKIFVPEENVVLVLPNDVDILFRALLDLVKFPEKREYLGNAARELSSNFSWKSITQQVANVFDSTKSDRE